MIRHPGLVEIVRRDPRYDYHAYEFVFQALHHTQKMLGHLPRSGPKAERPEHHVSGRQLLLGVKDLAHREFGLMARVVFKCWGINSTADFGEIVYNLIEGELMTRTEEDSRQDFHNVYDLDQALADYQIKLQEAE
jgi:uncharacterized repeat protein (TIGR04138 family)